MRNTGRQGGSVSHIAIKCPRRCTKGRLGAATAAPSGFDAKFYGIWLYHRL